MVPKVFLNMSEKYPRTVSVGPGIEPGTLRIRLQPLSEDQPIGLIIPSQQIGSPRMSYVSKLEEQTARNNLVAEKAVPK